MPALPPPRSIPTSIGIFFARRSNSFTLVLSS